MTQEERKTSESNPALSQLINEHYTHFLAFNKNKGYNDLEQKESALAAYEQAIELAPREAILHYRKGQVLEQLGRIAEANTAYEEARDLGY